MKNYVTNQLRVKKRKVIHDEIQNSKGDVKKDLENAQSIDTQEKQRYKN